MWQLAGFLSLTSSFIPYSLLFIICYLGLCPHKSSPISYFFFIIYYLLFRALPAQVLPHFSFLISSLLFNIYSLGLPPVLLFRALARTSPLPAYSARKSQLPMFLSPSGRSIRYLIIRQKRLSSRWVKEPRRHIACHSFVPCG